MSQRPHMGVFQTDDTDTDDDSPFKALFMLVKINLRVTLSVLNVVDVFLV